MKSLIQKLSETLSTSGYGTAIREVSRAEVKPYGEDIRVDALGNLIVRKGTKGKDGPSTGSGQGLRIMLAAHIDGDGFVRFTGVGGIRPAALTHRTPSSCWRRCWRHRSISSCPAESKRQLADTGGPSFTFVGKSME